VDRVLPDPYRKGSERRCEMTKEQKIEAILQVRGFESM
jgi:hypothetical protein